MRTPVCSDDAVRAHGNRPPEVPTASPLSEVGLAWVRWRWTGRPGLSEATGPPPGGEHQCALLAPSLEGGGTGPAAQCQSIRLSIRGRGRQRQVPGYPWGLRAAVTAVARTASGASQFSNIELTLLAYNGPHREQILFSCRILRERPASLP